MADRVFDSFHTRSMGHPAGTPPWVREIATVGDGPGWFEPNGVVWAVHGDVSTIVGGISALFELGTHPSAWAGVERHSNFQGDPWKRMAGTSQWVLVTTFGSAELSERTAGWVRGLHTKVQGSDDKGRAYAASDPKLLRWVFMALADGLLASAQAFNRTLVPRFGKRWADTYVHDWRRGAEALGATDLPSSAAELAEALEAIRPDLEQVPEYLSEFVLVPPGLNALEERFYAGLSNAAKFLVSPTVASLARVPGRSVGGVERTLRLQQARAQLGLLNAVMGRLSPVEEAARYRIGLGPRPIWL